MNNPDLPLDSGHLLELPWEVSEQTDDQSIYEATDLVDESDQSDHGQREVAVTQWSDDQWVTSLWDPVAEAQLVQIGPHPYRQDAELVALGLMKKRDVSTGSNPHTGDAHMEDER